MVSFFDETWPQPDQDSSLFDNRIWREWLSTSEAADYLRITPNALRIWVCRGKIRAHKLGRKLRFRMKDLRAFLQPKEA